MFEQITGMIIAALDVAFSPISILSPHVSLLIISIILTAIVLLINRFSINKKLMEEIKHKMEEIRESLTQAQKAGNTEEVNRFLNEMMKTNSQYMRQMLKAMVISIIILALFLPWLNYKYGGMSIVKLPFELPVLGASLNWVWWYVLVSFAMGWIIKKILGMDYA
jgi:uncharacterized membrane protein (DUF106 family)